MSYIGRVDNIKNGGTQPLEMLVRGMERFDYDKFALTRIHVKYDDPSIPLKYKDDE